MRNWILFIKGFCIILLLFLLLGCLNQASIYFLNIEPLAIETKQLQTKCSIDFTGLSPAGDLPDIPDNDDEIAEVLSRDILRLRAIINTRKNTIDRIKKDLIRCGVDVKDENKD